MMYRYKNDTKLIIFIIIFYNIINDECYIILKNNNIYVRSNNICLLFKFIITLI